MANGCGAKWMPKWTRNLLDRFFKESCNRHDDDYEKGGTEQDRRIADDVFFWNMRRETLNKKGFSRIILWIIRYVFYYSVRWFGACSFNYEKGDNK